MNPYAATFERPTATGSSTIVAAAAATVTSKSTTDGGQQGLIEAKGGGDPAREAWVVDEHNDGAVGQGAEEGVYWAQGHQDEGYGGGYGGAAGYATQGYHDGYDPAYHHHQVCVCFISFSFVHFKLLLSRTYNWARYLGRWSLCNDITAHPEGAVDV